MYCEIARVLGVGCDQCSGGADFCRPLAVDNTVAREAVQLNNARHAFRGSPAGQQDAAERVSGWESRIVGGLTAVLKTRTRSGS